MRFAIAASSAAPFFRTTMCESRPKRRFPAEPLDQSRPVIVNEFDGTVIWRAGCLAGHQASFLYHQPRL